MNKSIIFKVSFAVATIGRPFADISYQQILRTTFAQTFFGKSLTKNFFERLKGGGCRPHTPVSLIRATKGSAFGNRQLFEKSWAKTFILGLSKSRLLTKI